MALLPPAPKPLPVADLESDDPPAPPTNIYPQDLPVFLVSAPTPPPRPTAGDAVVDRAERRFEAGKRLYLTKDLAGARREFDAAVDLMLQASDSIPADRADYERKLDAMVESIHRYDLSGFGASASVDDGKFEKAPLEDILQMTFPVDPKLKDKVREQVKATVSQLPLSVNDAVLGYINYFSNRGHRTLIAGYERSGRYRPMIQRVLQEEGIPQELIHLAQAESGFIPRAVSNKAAGGMWQFVVFRGQQYGLMQSRYTDDRMDPEMATRAAAHHLHDLYNEFGDWYLAIAAYNCGPGVIEKAVERTGYADFWQLRERGALPAETTNYVPIILAMTIMEKNAAEYGLEGVQLDAPLEYDTIKTDAVTSLTLISDIADVPTAELAGINPAALKGMVPGSYPLHVPKGVGAEVARVLLSIPAERRASWRVHRVAPEETLAVIAKRYGVSTASIVDANQLASNTPNEGDRLIIPAAMRPENLRTVSSHATTGHASAKGSASHRARVTSSKTTANASSRKTTAQSKQSRKSSVILASASH
ncbi:MAG TPA: transglycosylase SLT domain-containing protein [Bryobacteraceae bacterium]|nr:transglycosylase SLT domain-containing protein [Bryobacteraceae bacterium]